MLFWWSLTGAWEQVILCAEMLFTLCAVPVRRTTKPINYSWWNDKPDFQPIWSHTSVMSCNTIVHSTVLHERHPFNEELKSRNFESWPKRGKSQQKIILMTFTNREIQEKSIHNIRIMSKSVKCQNKNWNLESSL